MAAKKKSSSTTDTIGEQHLAPAREVASQYTILLETVDAGGFRGRSLELPFVMGFGETAEACIDDVRGSLAVAIGAMLRDGETPPAPAREGKRDDQVNIKLTRYEKALFMQAARREGFRSVADFMRSLALRRLQ